MRRYAVLHLKVLESQWFSARYSLLVILQRHINVLANFFRWDKPAGSHPRSPSYS